MATASTSADAATTVASVAAFSATAAPTFCHMTTLVGGGNHGGVGVERRVVIGVVVIVGARVVLGMVVVLL